MTFNGQPPEHYRKGPAKYEVSVYDSLLKRRKVVHWREAPPEDGYLEGLNRRPFWSEAKCVEIKEPE